MKRSLSATSASKPRAIGAGGAAASRTMPLLRSREIEPAAASCGCGVASVELATDGRKAVAVDPGIKERNRKRLRRIEGQVRGLQRMVEEDRYCADILTQIASVHEALRAVGRELMRNHLRHCASSAIRAGTDEAEAMYDELIELMYRNVR